MIELTPNKLLDLVMILGAAEAAFSELSTQPGMTGVPRALLENYAQGAKELGEEIVRQHNEQFEREKETGT